MLQKEFSSRDYRPVLFELQFQDGNVAELPNINEETDGEQLTLDDLSGHSEPLPLNTKQLSVPPLRIKVNDRVTVAITGIVDRADMFRSEGGNEYIRIVDYKTGIINNPAGDLWDDAALFERMAQVRDERLPLEDRRRLAAGTFDQLAEKLRMIQLPAYLCMLHAAGFRELHDAALVELRDTGREYWLFGPSPARDNDERIRQCLSLIHI